MAENHSSAIQHDGPDLNSAASAHGYGAKNTKAYLDRLMLDAAGGTEFARVSTAARREEIKRKEEEDRVNARERFERFESLVGAEWEDRRNLKVEERFFEMKERLTEVKTQHREEKLRALLIDL